MSSKQLKVGDKAPNFTLPNQDGDDVKLSSYQGNPLILYFYSQDGSSGCTMEAENFRDNYPEAKKIGYNILGISKNSVESHQRFHTKLDLPFDILSDTEHTTMAAYGAWIEKTSKGKTHFGPNRITYLLDKDGVIIHIIPKVETKQSFQQIQSILSQSQS